MPHATRTPRIIQPRKGIQQRRCMHRRLLLTEKMPPCGHPLRRSRYASSGKTEEHWPGFVREYEVRLGRDGLALGEGVLTHLDWLKAKIAERPSALVHADLRADNLLFGDRGSPDAVVIVDWQLATRSMAAVDPTRLLGGSEPASQRNGHHLEVFTAWHETLLEHGVSGYEFDEALVDFRLGALYNLLVPVLAYGMTVGTASVRTARLLDAQVERMYVSATELNAGALLPSV